MRIRVIEACLVMGAVIAIVGAVFAVRYMDAEEAEFDTNTCQGPPTACIEKTSYAVNPTTCSCVHHISGEHFYWYPTD